MLDLFRRNRKTLVGGLIAAFCAVLMVGFGVDTYRTYERNRPIATVNNHDISSDQYRREYDQLAERYRQQLGKNYALFQDQLNLKKQTIDLLVSEALLGDLTDNLDMKVSLKQIEDKIRSYPFFAQGFSEQTYKQFLRATGMSGAKLQEITEKDVKRQQLIDTFSAIAVPSPEELKAVFNRDHTKIALNYVTFRGEDFISKVETSDVEKLKSFFKERQESYRVPKQVAFSWIELNPADFKSKVEFAPEDLQTYYDQHESNYTEPARLKVRQIYLRIEEDKEKKDTAIPFLKDGKEQTSESTLSPRAAKKQVADTVLAQLKEGKKFEELAKSFSEDTVTKDKGGDMGEMTYEALFPELRAAANKLAPGEFSNVIETKTGFHIIQVDDVTPKRLKPLEEVKAEVEDSYRTEESPLFATVEADRLAEELGKKAEDGKSGVLEAYAKESSKKLETTGGLVSANSAKPQVPMPLILKTLEMSAHEVHSVQLGNVAYVVEINELKDTHIPTFDEVKDRVLEDYKKSEAKKLAQKAAQEFLEAAKGAAGLDGAAKEKKLDIKKSGVVTAGNAYTEPFSAGKLREAAFTLDKVGAVAAEAYEDGNNFYVAALAESTPPTAEEFNAKSKELTTTEQEKVGSRMLEGLVAGLRGRAKTWTNKDFLGPTEGSKAGEV